MCTLELFYCVIWERCVPPRAQQIVVEMRAGEFVVTLLVNWDII